MFPQPPTRGGPSLSNSYRPLLTYTSRWKPSAEVEQRLREGRIIGEDETPQRMIVRVLGELWGIERTFGTPFMRQVD